MKKFINSLHHFCTTTTFISSLFLQFFAAEFLHAQTPLSQPVDLQPIKSHPIEYDFYENIFFTAEKLYKSEATKEAATEFKRYLFLQKYSIGKYQVQALDTLSKIYKNYGNFTLALEYNLKAQNYLILRAATTNTSASTELSLYPNEIVSQPTDFPPAPTNLSLKLSEIELTELIHIEQNKPLQNPRIFSYAKSEQWDEQLRIKAYKTIITLQIHQKNWDSAQTEFSELCKTFPKIISQENQEIFYQTLEKAQNFKPKNQTAAFYLSIIPGLGQLYAGEFKDSANAFLLNSALIGVSAYSLITFQIQDFILIESSPTMRFYTGNLINAQKETIAWNKHQIENLQNIMLAIIQMN